MARMLSSRSGTLRVRKNINPSPQSTTDVKLKSCAESEIALCVYDISNKKSFLVMNKWVKELQDNGPENMSNFVPDLVLVVVGNKCDKTEGEEVTYQEGK